MEKHPKYQNVIETGKKLFWKYGIKRVSIEEICKEANVSKMTYYKFFQNKNELVKTIYKNVMEDGMNQLETIINGTMPFEEKIEQLFLLKFNSTQHISREFIMEVYNSNHAALASMTKDYSDHVIKKMHGFFVAEQKNGNIRKDIKIEFIFYLLNKLQADGIDPKLFELYDNAQALIMEMMRFFINGIIQKQSE
jgi:AcrR family transcriptional regulator